jgi:ABC-type long-subunit fatty acid transport system fused permease/ATPase subunit
MRTWDVEEIISLAGLNYQFKKVEAGFEYRYLTTNDKDDAIKDLTIKGPYAGVRFFF